MKRTPMLSRHTALVGSGTLYLAIALVALSLFPQVSAAQQQGQAFFAVTSTNQLIQFSSAAPGTITGQQAISGLQANESIVGIDFRPATGQLYGLGSSSRLYTLNTQTGAGTVVGTMPISPTLAGTAFGIDFNPVPDRLRIVSNNGQNLRVNPADGVAVVDGTLTYTNTDTNAGQTPAVSAAAYTNNISGTTSTTLYGIDTNRDVLVIQSPPNNGVLATVGSLGTDASEVAGFDITPSGMAYAAITTSGSTISSLATINLKTGRATSVGTIGGGAIIRAIAAPALPPVDQLYGLTSGNRLIQFNTSAPGTIAAQKAITGLPAGESLVGIDFRPATGQLYGVSSGSRLYTIDPITAAATVIGTKPLSPTIEGAAFGVDFNPAADRIRIVSNSGQNLRINPSNAGVTIDGTLVYTTTDINNGVTPAVVAAAYTNSFSGTTSTALYVIDAGKDSLALQNPPNNGVLSTIGSLGIDASNLSAFDISPSGAAYVAITTANATSSTLGTIDLATGRVASIGTIGGGETIIGLAVSIPPPVAQLYGLTSANRLVQFSSAAPNKIGSQQPITGLLVGDSLLGIDFRPATGQLYGVSSGSRLYTIDPTTAIASVIGTLPLSPVLVGTAFGIDFNPIPDRIRIVSNSGQNLRVNPANGAVTLDGTLVYTTTDTTFGVVPTVVAAAYTNSFSGTTSTALYVIDAGRDSLALQNPPNNGVLSTIGPLGVDASDLSAFDISPLGGAYVAITTPNATSSTLGTIDLATGRVAQIGTIGGGETIIGLAVSPKPRSSVYLPLVLRR